MKDLSKVNSSLVRFIGMPKFFSQTEMAEAAGVGIIPLQHHRKIGRSRIQSVGGFQGCIIIKNDDGVNGQITYTKRFDKDSSGLDFDPGKVLYYEPDRNTNKLVAWVPDTKFNRASLARRYGKKGCPIILDKDIEKEILELAKKLPVLGEKTLTNVELLKIKTREQEEELSKMRKELAEIKSKDTITSKAAEDMARKMAIEEKADLIEALKDENPKGGYQFSQRYKDEVLPLKEKYLKQIRQDYKVLD